jgi:hypothetical protein
VIRLATEDDLPELVEMARAFHDAHGQGFPFDEKSAETFIINAGQRGCVLFSEGSFLIGFLMPDPANFNVLVAHEAFWWSSTGKGKALREAFEKWAKAAGAREVQFSHPWEAERVGEVLKGAGYEPATKVWRKVI